MPAAASTRLALVGPLGTDAIASGDDIIRAIIAQLDPIAAMWVAGTRAGMPIPATATAGRIYRCTDTNGVYLDVGTTYHTVKAPRVTALPSGTLYDGEEIILAADATNGVLWHLRYNASGGSYKWEFVGGPALVAEVATLETTTSTSYAALTTAGPAITLPTAGDFDVEIGSAAGTAATAGTGAVMSYDIGGTGAVDADGIGVTNVSGTAIAQQVAIARTKRKTGLTAITLTAKYKSSGSAVSSSYGARFMRVTPVRVG